jgi:hypothetical protein
LRRWHRLAIAKHSIVEWNGRPVRSVRKGFASAVNAAMLEHRYGHHHPDFQREAAAAVSTSPKLPGRNGTETP